jgi:hypothetical protein
MMVDDDVCRAQEYVTNPRGVQLFTCGWLPPSSSPKALVFLCHGNVPLTISSLLVNQRKNAFAVMFRFRTVASSN